MFAALPASRERLLEIFGALRKEAHLLEGATAEEVADRCQGLGFEKTEFIYAIRVFEELGLISFADGALTVYRGIKAELTDSKLYRKVCLLQRD